MIEKITTIWYLIKLFFCPIILPFSILYFVTIGNVCGGHSPFIHVPEIMSTKTKRWLVCIYCGKKFIGIARRQRTMCSDCMVKMWKKIEVKK